MAQSFLGGEGLELAWAVVCLVVAGGLIAVGPQDEA